MYVMLLLVYAFHLGSGVITRYMLTAVKLGKELAICDVCPPARSSGRAAAVNQIAGHNFVHVRTN